MSLLRFAKDWLISITLLSLTGCSTHQSGQSAPVVQRTSAIAFTNATVVDNRAGEQRSPVTLVVAGNRIAADGRWQLRQRIQFWVS